MSLKCSAHELRKSFLEYFGGLDHTIVPSSPLIPQADPTILFTNAGMNQFKRVFLGEDTRSYPRAVSVQKCMRAGGKHNDLENVGYTRRHHTFFEMLGNFSFGDYFKEEAIRFGWDYLTQRLKLPPDRLWVTVFQDDDEAFQLWEKHIGLPKDRIVRMGEKDNFWQMGDTGPCGPCSEILIDQGADLGCGRPTCAVGCDCDRYLEIWNLVFMQYDRDVSGTLHPLPKPSIDTGMGLERLAAVVQEVSSNYDSDLFAPLLSAIGNRTGHVYGDAQEVDRSLRVIADHLRAMTFLVADGILPSNEGRGYVLRRILRRASRHGRLLGTVEPFLHDLTRVVVEQMKDTYPELSGSAAVIDEVVAGEEDRFIDTLDQGLPILTGMVNAALSEGRASLEGNTVFKLYDTYGFPLDLIEEAAREQGLGVDLEGFQRALEDQRDRARKSAAFAFDETKPLITEIGKQVKATKFEGYETLETESVIQAIVKDEHLVEEAVEGDAVELVLDVTPFYPEGGGQVGDHGVLIGGDGQVRIDDTSKAGSEVFFHKGTVTLGRIRKGDTVHAAVNSRARQDAARNHTGTHLVHAALREILGPHVKQYGSLVTPTRLRFDFAHFKPLSYQELEEIESVVNEQIMRNTVVQTDVMALQEAVGGGALAFFGDKYADRVRVVEIGSFSKELCGGTHCRRTGDIGLFKVVSESGVAAGVRRLEALTGAGALKRSQHLESELREVAETLKTGSSEVVSRTKKVLSSLKEKERELEQVKFKLAGLEAGDAKADVRSIRGAHVHVQRIDGMTMQELRTISDNIRNKVSSGVIALGSVQDGKVSLLAVVTKDLVGRLKAGDLVKLMAAEVGGSGGGRPEMAQAGGKFPEKLGAALGKVFPFVEDKLGS